MQPLRSVLLTIRSLAVGVVLLTAAALQPHGVAIARVSASGGVPSYVVPIAVPPGIGGIEPKLAIAHTGGELDGPLGTGWALQGLSVISRCPPTYAIDSKRAGVSYAPSDKLCLDGQRLIPIDGGGNPQMSIDDARGVGAGLPYREYRTEKDTYSRIRAYGSANGSDVNGPQYFVVWTKAGLIQEYGATPDSAIEAQGKNVVMAWGLNKISDTTGSAMELQYEERSVAAGSGPSGSPTAGKEWNVQRIVYTSRPGGMPVNRVDFVYVDRSFGRAEAFQQGSKNVSVRLLTEIRTFTNQQGSDPLPSPGPIPATNSIPAKVYKLAYEPSAAPSTGRTRLKSIAECAGTDTSKCFPPHEFLYSDGGNEAYSDNGTFNLAGQVLLTKNGQKGVITGDFNGDGRTDILRWSNPPNENALWLSAPEGTTLAPQWHFAAPTAFNLAGVWLGHQKGCFTTLVADFNGDGRSDLLRVSTVKDVYGTDINDCLPLGVNPANATAFFLGNGDGSFSGPIFLQGGMWLDRRWPMEICDPGGDGEGSCQWYYQNTTCASAPKGPGFNFSLGDYDGDGRTDVLFTSVQGIAVDDLVHMDCIQRSFECASGGCNTVWLSNGDGTFTSQTSGLPNRSMYTNPSDRYVLVVQADLNDDRRADFISYYPGPQIYYSTPSGYVSVPGAVGCIDESALFVDANGDRRLDFFCTGALNVGLGGESGFSSIQSGIEGAGPFFSAFNSQGSFYGRVITSAVETADFNGDGRSDILRWGQDPTLNELWLANANGTYTLSTSFAGWAKAVNLRENFDPNNINSGRYDFLLGDFTGRGGVDILRTADSSAGSNQLYVKNSSTYPDQLVQVRTPTGAVSQIAYQRLSSALDPIYESLLGTLGGSPYPIVDVRPPLSMVASLTTDAGMSSLTTTQRYFYRGLKVALDGRGSLGFRETQRASQGPSGEWLTEVTTNATEFPFTGSAESVVLRRGQVNEGGQTLSTTTYQYCDKLFGPRVGCLEASVSRAPLRQPYVRETKTTANDLAGAPLPVTTTINTFNDWGDPTVIDAVTQATVVGLGREYRKITTNEYLPPNTAGDAWILGRLSKSTVQSSVTEFKMPDVAYGPPGGNATQGAFLSVEINPPGIDVVGSIPGPLSANATATAAGAVGPYTYTWTGGSRIQVSGAQTATFTPVPNLTWSESVTETFTVTARDSTGTTVTKNITVKFSLPPEPPPPVVTANPAQLPNYRLDPGLISASSTASVSGGVPPLTYSWARIGGTTNVVSIADASSPTATFSATLGWGQSTDETFRVTVTDAISRTHHADVQVLFAVPQVTISPKPVTGYRPNPGPGSATASVSVAGMQPPLIYQWSRVTGSRIQVSGGQTAAFTVDPLGWSENLTETFKVTVADALSRVGEDTVNVTFTTPPPLSASVPGSAYGDRLGGGPVTSNPITVTPSGGTGGYTYSWVPASTNGITVSSTTAQTVTFSANLAEGASASGVFTVYVTDSASNQVSYPVSVTLVAHTLPTVSLSTTNIYEQKYTTFNGSASFNHSVIATVGSGGLAPYTLTWQLVGGKVPPTVTPSSAVVGSPSGTQSFAFTATVKSDFVAYGQFVLVITDARGGTTTSPTLTVNYVATCGIGFCP